MSQINVIVQGTQFKVSKELLEKSGYFKDLFETYDDNIEIDVVNPETFQIILSILDDHDIGKEIAFGIDFFRIEGNTNLIKSYLCNFEGCEIIMLNEKYCENHRCISCSAGKFKGNYCKEHVCPISNCINEVSCEQHKCKECDSAVHYDNSNIYSYCIGHKCVAINCDSIIQLGECCYSHKCNNYYCDNIKYDKYDLCIKHKCAYGSCNKEVDDSYYNNDHHLCTIHKCSDNNDCSNLVFENSKYCYLHLKS